MGESIEITDTLIEGADQATPEQTDLKEAYKALHKKQAPLLSYWNYYEGDQPLRWSIDKLKEVFNDKTVNFVENWCSIIVDSVLDRLCFRGFKVADEVDRSKELEVLYKNTRLGVEASDMHEDLAICGESFLIVWKDEEAGTPEIYHNYARNCHMFYEQDNPHKKRFAAKWYVDAKDRRHVTLYYTDRLEYWVSSTPSKGETRDFKSGDWTQDEDEGEAKNPFGEIPVFHFQLSKNSRSVLNNALPLQDIINKLTSDMIVTAEFAAYPQRWIISNMEEDGKLPIGPASTLNIPAADIETQPTAVGTFPAADLGNFMKAIDSKAQTMAIQSRTPKHFFFAQGGTPSGEALISAESPLNKKVEKYIERLDGVWLDLGKFLVALVGGEFKDGAFLPENLDDGEGLELETVWLPVQTITPKTLAEIRKIETESGIPIEVILRREGWSEEEIKAVNDGRAKVETVTSAPGTTPDGKPAGPKTTGFGPEDKDKQDAAIDAQAAALAPEIANLLESLSDALIDYMSQNGGVKRMLDNAKKQTADNK